MKRQRIESWFFSLGGAGGMGPAARGSPGGPLHLQEPSRPSEPTAPFATRSENTKEQGFRAHYTMAFSQTRVYVQLVRVGPHFGVGFIS